MNIDGQRNKIDSGAPALPHNSSILSKRSLRTLLPNNHDANTSKYGDGSLVALAPPTTAANARATISGRKFPGAQSNTTPFVRSKIVRAVASPFAALSIKFPAKMNPPFDATCTTHFPRTCRASARRITSAYASTAAGTSIAALGGAIATASQFASTYIAAYFFTCFNDAPNHPTHIASGRSASFDRVRSSQYGASFIARTSSFAASEAAARRDGARRASRARGRAARTLAGARVRATARAAATRSIARGCE